MKKVLMRTMWAVLLLVCLLPLPLGAQIAAGKSKFLGNIWSAGTEPGNFNYYWNQVTPGVSGKWAACEQARDDMNYWLWLDRCYNAAKANNLIFKEHTLIWGHATGTPSWLSSLTVAEQTAEIEEWFQAVAERYPDLELIDVVNEPLHVVPSFAAAMGGNGSTGWDWVIWAFQKARQYFPGSSKLILNDYNILAYNDGTTSFLTIINLLKDRGLIDGIGVQGHSLESVSASVIKGNLDRLGATGLPIYISEYEIALADDAAQLAVYQTQFPLFWEHASVAGVTLWGYIQGDMWRADGWLVSTDGRTERPAMKWLREYFGQNPNLTPPPTRTPSPAPSPTPTPTPVVVSCTGIAAWDAATIYPDAGGTQVVYNNKLYRNNWYTVGDNPEQNSGLYAVWTLLGACTGGTTPATPTPTATRSATTTSARTATRTATATSNTALGDVNASGTIDIVDALMTAQYYVGLNPAGFTAANADVNRDGQITIVDALMIAQYYVGLITGF